MKPACLFRVIWFKADVERRWFTNQFSIYYSAYRRSVVLYALRRLALIFKTQLTNLDGDLVLTGLGNTIKRRKWLSYILPTECHRNPLQIIVDDFTCADEYLRDGHIHVPASVHARVFDYVRFIVEFDWALEKDDHLRVVSLLGLTPP